MIRIIRKSREEKAFFSSFLKTILKNKTGIRKRGGGGKDRVKKKKNERESLVRPEPVRFHLNAIVRFHVIRSPLLRAECKGLQQRTEDLAGKYWNNAESRLHGRMNGRHFYRYARYRASDTCSILPRDKKKKKKGKKGKGEN